MAQAYNEIQLINISPWHIPISSQAGPTSQLSKDVTTIRSSASGHTVTRHTATCTSTGSAHPAATRCSQGRLQCPEHPLCLSLHSSSERLQQPQNHGSAGGKGSLENPGLPQAGGWSIASTSTSRYSSVYFHLENTKGQRSHTDTECLEGSM